jgi:hypothetical protein
MYLSLFPPLFLSVSHVSLSSLPIIISVKDLWSLTYRQSEKNADQNGGLISEWRETVFQPDEEENNRCVESDFLFLPCAY